jgi:hypothetical protein
MRLIPIWPLVFVSIAAGETPANWSSKYPPCNRHAELLKQGHLTIGVRLTTRNPVLAEQFRHAMDSWAKVLDLDWHEENTQACSIQLIDGDRELFEAVHVAARSQMPDRVGFQGGIAFNPKKSLDEADFYRISVHEIGHLLGLQHSPSAISVMYFLDLDGTEWLDPVDLAELAKHHKLRIADLDKPVDLRANTQLVSPK